MFTFFRKIRISLMAGNSVKKYMLYAFGEIALVVIGILIALQVNNWNLERQEKRELRGYLITIAKNIQGDLPEIQKLKSERDSVLIRSRKSFPLVGKSFYDFPDIHYINKTIISSFEVKNFNCNQSGFESLKSSGLIGKIQGTAVADSIFDYYRKAGIINNLVNLANTYSQGMQLELMKQEFAPEWARINGNMRRAVAGSDREFLKNSQSVLKKVYHHPAVFGMFARNTSDSQLQEEYERIHQLGLNIIQEIGIDQYN